jgi:DNA-binding GntR family transcriptional regulator
MKAGRLLKFKASENLAVQIADWLGERIIHLELKPGQRIVEARLAEELGVSRSPIREALRMLADNGLVELLPRRGARVTEMTAESVSWLNDILKELLSLVVRKATENRTTETLKPIAAAVRDMEDCAAREDVDGYMEAIMRFGLASCVASRNLILEKMIIYIWPITNRVMYASHSQQKSELKKNFQLILRCYREGDADSAALVMRELVEHDEQFVLRMIAELEAQTIEV